MKTILRGLTWLLFIVVFLYVMYWLWGVISVHYDKIILYGYVGLATLFFFVLAFFQRKLTNISVKNINPSNASFLSLAAIGALGPLSISKVRKKIAFYFDLIANSLAFPSLIFSGNKTRSIHSITDSRGVLLAQANYNILYGVQFTNLLVYFCFSLLSLFFYTIGEKENAVIWSTLSVVGVFSSIAASLISGISIPKIFKLQIGNPYLRFILYSVCMSLILIYSFLIIKNYVYEVKLNTDVFILTVKELFVPTYFYEVIHNIKDVNNLSITMMFVGVTFYLTIASSIFRWKDFLRNQDDIASISKSLIVIGKYTDALNFLNKEKSSALILYTIKGMALLCINRLNEGFNYLKKGRHENSSFGKDICLDSIFTGISFSLPSRVNMKIIDIMLKEGDSSDDLYLILQSGKTIFSNDDLVRISIDPRIKNLPLHYAIILFQLEKFDEFESIISEFSPSNGFEKVNHFLMGLYVEVKNSDTIEETHEIIHTWMDDKLSVIEEVSCDLEGMHLMGIFIIITASKIIKESGVNREQELEYLLQKLREKISNKNPTGGLSDFILKLENSV